MNTQVRFLVAMALMIAVLVLTNILFPPVPPEPPTTSEPIAEGAGPEGAVPADPETVDLSQLVEGTPEQAAETPADTETAPVPLPESAEAAPPLPGLTATAREVVVEGPLFRYRLSTVGATVASLELPTYRSFQFDGPVRMVPDGGIRPLGNRLLVGRDTLNLRDSTFTTSAPESVITLAEGGSDQSVTFTYRHPSGAFTFEVTYTFAPDRYFVDVSGSMTRIDGAVLLTDLGSGIPPNEQRRRDDEAMHALVTRDANESIRAERLDGFDEREVVEGPFTWVAFKSKFFVTAALAGRTDLEPGVFGGALVGEWVGEQQASVAFTQAVGQDGSFAYRAYFGPQERDRLLVIGQDMHEVNPYGWRFLRPIIRPFTGIIVYVLDFLHDALGWGYGWVLIVFGVMMRVVLFPLHMKAMRAQLRNMAVQPRLKEIQEKYKNEPERLQKEMVRLYKEEGFNPLAGCLPMLLPWPILVALFFVFQYSIQFRGVPFLWLPDLSAPDPLYLLPVFLGLSMFVLQWVSIRTIENPNPQLKMMMWIMPFFMGFIFMQFASGLNLYYSVANVASLPQQIWVAQERKRAQQKTAAKSGGGGAAVATGGSKSS